MRKEAEEIQGILSQIVEGFIHTEISKKEAFVASYRPYADSSILKAALQSVEMILKGALQEAELLLNSVIALYPDVPELLNIKGIVVLTHSGPEAAEQAFRSVIAFDKSNYNALSILGELFILQQKHQEALQLYIHALQHYPSNETLS